MSSSRYLYVYLYTNLETEWTFPEPLLNRRQFTKVEARRLIHPDLVYRRFV